MCSGAAVEGSARQGLRRAVRAQQDVARHAQAACAGEASARRQPGNYREALQVVTHALCYPLLCDDGKRDVPPIVEFTVCASTGQCGRDCTSL